MNDQLKAAIALAAFALLTLAFAGVILNRGRFYLREALRLNRQGGNAEQTLASVAVYANKLATESDRPEGEQDVGHHLMWILSEWQAGKGEEVAP